MRPRVFAIAPDCHIEGSRYGDGWRRHFYEGLGRGGADVRTPSGVSFAWARAPYHLELDFAAQTTTTERLWDQISSEIVRGLDVVISYCFARDVDLTLIDRVREAGVPWINFFCDSLHGFHEVEALARAVDLNWYVEGGARELYEALHVPSIWAPYALNPASLPDAACERVDRAMVFVGTPYAERARAIAILTLLGVDIHVVGWDWEARLMDASGPLAKRVRRKVARWVLRNRIAGYLEVDPLMEYLRGSQVVLGLNQGPAHSGSTSYLKMRDIEFPGLGCCYMAQRHDDLTRLFADDEVALFSSISEAWSLSRHFSRAPTECLRRGQKARKRVLGEHTWTTRLPQLMAALR